MSTGAAIEERPDRIMMEATEVTTGAGPLGGSGNRTSWRRVGMMLALTAALGLLGGAALWGQEQLASRDAELTARQQEIARFETAVAAAQEQIGSLTAERDQVSADLTTRTAERDRAQATADAQAQQLQAATQQAQAADDRARAADARAASAEARARDADARASQAQKDAAAPQQRAQEAEARSAALARVIDVDNQIVGELRGLMNQWMAMVSAAQRGQMSALQQSLVNQATALDRIDALLRQRDAALNRVPRNSSSTV